MRNLEGMPPEEENEGIKPEDDFFEDFGLSEEPMAEAENKREAAEEPGFEENMEAVREQQEEIRIETRERGDKGILTRLSQGGKRFAGITLLSLSSFAAATAYHNRPGVSKTPELQDSPKIESVSTELTLKDEERRERETKKGGHIIKRVEKVEKEEESRGEEKKEEESSGEEKKEEGVLEDKEVFAPKIEAPISISLKKDLEGRSYSKDEGRVKEREPEENNEGFASENATPEDRGFKIDSDDYSKEKTINRQAERRIGENFRYFMENSNVISLKDGSFAVDIGINRGGDDRVVAEIKERPCYKVEPEDLVELERIRKEHLKKVGYALSKRPFIPTEVKEGIRRRTERSLKRAIMYCEKIPQEQLPEEIKELRAKEKEEIEKKKVKIIAKNKAGAGREKVKINSLEGSRTEDLSEGAIRKISDPKERLEKRLKSIREIRSRGEK